MTHTMVELAERCEQAEGADRDLDVAIITVVGRKRIDDWWIGHKYVGRQAPAYTASVDAAMTLGGSSDIVREALSGLRERFALHMAFWPDNQPYAQWFARYVTAAALRAMAAFSGEG